MLRARGMPFFKSLINLSLENRWICNSKAEWQLKQKSLTFFSLFLSLIITAISVSLNFVKSPLTEEPNWIIERTVGNFFARILAIFWISFWLSIKFHHDLLRGIKQVKALGCNCYQDTLPLDSDNSPIKVYSH